MSRLFNKGWYVIYVRPRCEKKVNDLLSKHHLEPYLPLVKKIKQRSDRKKVVYEPLFPSYVFIYIENASMFSKALAIDGVLNFIKFSKKYASVSDKEINNIKILLEGACSNIEVVTALPKSGEIKRITSGLLSGLECEILSATQSNKILVRITSIQMNLTATLPTKYLGSPLNNYNK